MKLIVLSSSVSELQLEMRQQRRKHDIECVTVNKERDMIMCGILWRDSHGDGDLYPKNDGCDSPLNNSTAELLIAYPRKKLTVTGWVMYLTQFSVYFVLCKFRSILYLQVGINVIFLRFIFSSFKQTCASC